MHSQTRINGVIQSFANVLTQCWHIYQLLISRKQCSKVKTTRTRPSRTSPLYSQSFQPQAEHPQIFLRLRAGKQIVFHAFITFTPRIKTWTNNDRELPKIVCSPRNFCRATSTINMHRSPSLQAFRTVSFTHGFTGKLAFLNRSSKASPSKNLSSKATNGD